MMKKRNGILTTACFACVMSVTSSLPASTFLTTTPPGVGHSVDDVDAAIAFHTGLTDLGSYLIGDARRYNSNFGFFVDAPPGAMTSGRARSLVGAFVSLISLVFGVLALVRASGRTAAIVALLLGLVGMVLSVVHLGSSTGFGTGGGRAGAIGALVLGLIGVSLGGLALLRSQRHLAATSSSPSLHKEERR